MSSSSQQPHVPPRPPQHHQQAQANVSSRPGTAISSVSSIPSSAHLGPSPIQQQQQQQGFSLWRDRPSTSNIINASGGGPLPPRRPTTTTNTSTSYNNNNNSTATSGNSDKEGNQQQYQFLLGVTPGFAHSTHSRRQKLGSSASTSRPVIRSDTNLDQMFGSLSGSNHNGNHQDFSATTVNNNNIFALTSSNNNGKNFRSPFVNIQVALHEIAANVIPKDAMPEPSRARRLLELLRSTGSLCSDTVMSHVLHILSLELHRCVFGRSQTSIQKYADNLLSAAGSGTGGQPVVDPSEEDDDVAYFEQLEEVSREHRLLLAELNAVENTNRQDQMAAELERFRQVVPFYEHEIGRLNRESSKKGDESEGLRDELAMLQRIHERSIVDFEVQNKLLLKDVRELQVRLFQVSKSAVETEAGEEMYQMLKTSKSEQLHGMFEQCNERASLSLFMIQIEFLLNTVISRHESSLLNAPSRRWPTLIAKFRVHDTECLLEEYNQLADRREHLDVQIDHERKEVQAQVTALMTSEDLLKEKKKRLEILNHKSAVKGPASSDCTMMNHHENNTGKGKMTGGEEEKSIKAVKSHVPALTSRQRAEKMFAERLSDPNNNIFVTTSKVQNNGSDVQNSASPNEINNNNNHSWLLERISQQQHKLRANLHFGQNVQAFHQSAVQPLLELTAAKRFRTSVEVHSETATGDEFLVKTVSSINPLQTMKLPARTNLIKLKFVNPMLKNPARKFGDDERDFLVEDQIRSGANVMDWLPDNSAFDGTGEEDEERKKNQGIIHYPHQNVSGATPTKSSPTTKTTTGASPKKSRVGENQTPAKQKHSSPSAKSDVSIATKSPSPGLRAFTPTLTASRSPSRNNNNNSGALQSPSATSSSPHQDNNNVASQNSAQFSIWEEFRHRFGSYFPAMPRKLRVDLCDLHMCRAFLHLRKKLYKRFCDKVDSALKSGAETMDSASYFALKDTTDTFSHRALQAALLDSLEEVYIYPELVMKVSHELLSAMETLVQQNQAPHLEIYLRALSGKINPFYASFIAVVNYKLGANWPQPTLREDDPKGGIPASDVLALFSMLFPNADTELFRPDAVPSVEPLLEHFLGGVVADQLQTLAAVRRFINQVITDQTDPWSSKINEAVTFYAEESQWSQLDAEGAYQAVKSMLVTSTASRGKNDKQSDANNNDGDGSFFGNNNNINRSRSNANNNSNKTHQQQYAVSRKVGQDSARNNTNNNTNNSSYGDGTELKNRMMLHVVWTCAQMGKENRLPLEECTRVVTEMIAVATHASGIELPEDIDFRQIM